MQQQQQQQQQRRRHTRIIASCAAEIKIILLLAFPQVRPAGTILFPPTASASAMTKRAAEQATGRDRRSPAGLPPKISAEAARVY